MENLSQSKLKELESKCIQEEEPWCNATCPIHIDARQISKLVSSGDFTQARKIYEKKIVFPNIMSRICDEKCKSECKRKNLGNSINMRQLELSCMKYGKEVKSRTLFKAKKKEKILILGSNFSELTTAFELKNKGYNVDLYEKKDILGKDLYIKYKDVLDGDIIKTDLDKIQNLGVKIYCDSKFEIEKLEEYKESYDAVVVQQNTYSENMSYNDITFQYKDDKIFVSPSDLSEIELISVGKSIATSITRYFQSSNMIQAREKEGAYETKLYTNLYDITTKEEVIPQDKFYTQDEAIEEAKRCIDCNCLECVKGCEFLRHYNSYPKKLVREVYNNLSIALGNRTSNKMTNSCSLCGQCSSICPGGLDLGEVCEFARNQMVTTNKMPPSAFEFAIDDMEFSNSDEFFTVIKKEQLNYVFFPGCQLCASEPDLVKVVYSDLNKKLNNEVGMILGCCGVIGKWSGQDEKFKNEIKLIQQTLKQMNNPLLITACPTCYKIFSENLENIDTKMIYDYIDEEKLVPVEEGKKISVDDPCTVRYDKKIQTKVRDIITKLGFEIEELDYNMENTTCCGYGGLTCFSNKELQENIVSSRIKQSDLDYLTYCINCRDSFLGQQKQAKHILQLIYNFEGKNKKPTLSERRYNRVQLKLDLTNDKQQINKYENNLIIDNELQEKLEDRMILYKDIQDTIKHASETNTMFFNKSNNHNIASYRIKNVTFWVEYSKEDDEYLIHNAYSHRMRIEED